LPGFQGVSVVVIIPGEAVFVDFVARLRLVMDPAHFGLAGEAPARDCLFSGRPMRAASASLSRECRVRLRRSAHDAWHRACVRLRGMHLNRQAAGR